MAKFAIIVSTKGSPLQSMNHFNLVQNTFGHRLKVIKTNNGITLLFGSEDLNLIDIQ
ncbi:hypothetical protein GCM10009133_06670 [Cocleimonas flava]